MFSVMFQREVDRKEMSDPLLPGAALGAVFGELLKAVLEAIRRCVNFKETLAHLSTTLTRLGPKIQEIQELNNELGRPKEELEPLFRIMREGTQLVLECSKITKYDLVGKTRYEGKLQQLIKSLERFITIDLQVQNAIHIRKIRSVLDKLFVCGKPKEDATPLPGVGQGQEQLERLLSVLTNRFTNPSAPNDSKSMTSLQKSSTNGIDLVNFCDKGKLKVKLVQAKKLRKKYIILKPDPSAVLYIQASGDTEKECETIENDFNPIWNERFDFDVEVVSTKHLIVDVYKSKHFPSSKFAGCAKIQLSGLQPGQVKYVWSKLDKPLKIQQDNKNRGQVHVELLYCPFGMEDSFTNLIAPNCSGVLSVIVKSAENLPASRFMGNLDAFVVLTLRTAKSKVKIKNKTRVMKHNLNPNWEETFAFAIEDGLHDMVIVKVWDKNTFGKDYYIGRCVLSLTKVILEGEYEESFELVGAKSGSLKLNLKWRR